MSQYWTSTIIVDDQIRYTEPSYSTPKIWYDELHRRFGKHFSTIEWAHMVMVF